ncbi:MAG: hypothetical protein WCX71_05305 [Candidatus Buchananbacteria bacterium]
MKKIIGFYQPLIFQPYAFFQKNYFKKKNFFLSFADALVCLIKQLPGITGQDNILLPNFYCPDTLNFISHYGRLIFYKVNSDFSIDKENYFEQIAKFNPKIIINYCFTGFELTLEEKTRLLQTIKPDTIIIDDFAHRIIEPEKIDYLNNNHFIIDSIRKHSPVLGSHLLGQKFLCQNKNVAGLNLYKLKAHFWQLIKGALELGSYLFRSVFLNDLSEKAFLIHDEIIGNNPQATGGSWLSFLIYNLIDRKKLKAHYHQIAMYYNQKLSETKNALIYNLDSKIIKKSELNYYPLFVNNKIKFDLLQYLREKNIFADILWPAEEVKNQELNYGLYDSFIIFPLNYLINKDDIDYLAKNIDEFFKKYDHR